MALVFKLGEPHGRGCHGPARYPILNGTLVEWQEGVSHPLLPDQSKIVSRALVTSAVDRGTPIITMIVVPVVGGIFEAEVKRIS